MKNFLSFGIVIVFLVGLFFLTWQEFRVFRPANIKIVKIAGTEIIVDVANTPKARTQGLSGRASLKEDEGMLFIFDSSGIYTFWMKDMNFPIDIIWINQNLEVVYIKKNATPESYPATFGPEENALYVLEVVSGFSETHNLKLGDEARFAF